MKKKFYITTTLPYVNADPHIGFAWEAIQADVLSRYYKLQGYDVVYNYGTDEHGVKVFNKAKEEHKDPKTYCDESVVKYQDLKKLLNLSTTNFIRTTDKHHIKAAKEFWTRCYKNGDIYKKNYETKYCIGCELEKTDTELENGKCPIHPNTEIEIRNEENYFFRFSKYQKGLLALYKERPGYVIPDNRLKEIKLFVASGLQDFSISRLKSKMPWGIDVPNDPEHVMYVWFDALINYISTLGWPENDSNFQNFWPGVQVAGKDNLRQQSAMWQAMLASAGLPNSKQIFIHGFITSNGQKMSKSFGNVIDPFEYVDKYGTDALRYYLLAKVSPFEDSDFTKEGFEQVYQADMANGIGNLVSRVAKMAENINLKTCLPAGKAEKQKNPSASSGQALKISKKIGNEVEKFRFDNALALIWERIREQDRYINENKVWQLDKDKQKKALLQLISNILQVSADLTPFLPETAKKIEVQFSGPLIKSEKPLFPRI